MKPNINSPDRAIRIIAAALITILYFTNVINGTFGAVMLAIGGILLVTGLVNFCPLYAIFGISTKKDQKKAIN